MIKNYFAGMEETVGRFLSFFATLVFFSIYILSKDTNTLLLDWSKLMIHLTIFWFVYELIGYILFLILMQFSKNKMKQAEINIPPISTQESNPEDSINN
jgi:hypothetical protein